MFVNNNWYIICSTFFYRTLKFYYKEQLYKFIEFATTTKINQQPICNLVRHIILDDCFERDPLIQANLKRLHDTCPNISSIDCQRHFNISKDLNFSELSNWFKWSKLPFWITKHDKKWYQYIQPHNNYTSLGICIKKNMVQWADQHDGNSNDNNDKKKNECAFYLQGWKINQLQKLKIHSSFIFPRFQHKLDVERIESSNEDNEDDDKAYFYYYYYNKMVTLPATISFIHLKHLLIDFYELCKNHREKLYGLNFDERIIESILQSCPDLESLHMNHFYMNLSNSYQTLVNETTASVLSPTIKPYLPLKSLTLESCTFLHPECFDYFGIKFKNLSTLSLYTNMNSFTNTEICNKYQISYYNMLSAFYHLSTLSTSSHFWEIEYYTCGNPETWKDTKLLYWLSNKPKPLTSLTCYYNLLSLTEDVIDDKYNDDQQLKKLKQKYSYIAHLQELKLMNQRYLNEPFINLTSMFKIGICFGNLTTFIIEYTFLFPPEDNCIQLYSWLDLLPNLKKLIIHDTLPYMFDSNKKNFILELHQHHQQRNKTYPLEELIIRNAELSLVNGLTGLGYTCPSLKKLRLIDVLISDGYHTRNNADIIVMDAPHLKLDEFIIKNMITTTNKDIPGNIKRSLELMVTESNSRNTNRHQSFTIKSPLLCEKKDSNGQNVCNRSGYKIYECQDYIYSTIKIILNCEYADLVYGTNW
ncbi:unnamed protein product [Cunninghamella echinulata]